MTSPTTRWRTFAALLVTVIALGIGLPMGARHVDPPHAHPTQASITASPTLASMIAEHPHLRDAMSLLALDMEATAGLPRTNFTLLDLGLVLLLGTALICWRMLTGEAGRGPPRPAVLVETGRAVLTRFCISRR